jgi:hypothetical protein
MKPFDAWLFACDELRRREIIRDAFETHGDPAGVLPQLKHEIIAYQAICTIIEKAERLRTN